MRLLHFYCNLKWYSFIGIDLAAFSGLKYQAIIGPVCMLIYTVTQLISEVSSVRREDCKKFTVYVNMKIYVLCSFINYFSFWLILKTN